MRRVASFLNDISGGRITPNQITYTGFLMHIPIAVLIATGQNLPAALLLIIFGLFDTLDGELARLQKTSSPAGMFLDSATDRIKEVMLYCGIVAQLVGTNNKLLIIACVGALGASLCTSYLNAWGEAVLANHKSTDSHTVNNTFRSGLLGFDLRMLLIILGLIASRLDLAIYTIFALATFTVFQRFMSIKARLSHVQN